MSTKTSRKYYSHTPNHIPVRHRVVYIILAIILLAYGTFGLYIDDIFLPGKRTPGTHYHGTAAVILYLAFVAVAANLISMVIDHYDKRNNQTNYRAFARISMIAALCFFILAALWDLLKSLF